MRFLILACAIAGAAVAQQEVVGKLDPRADDWPAEALAATAGEHLNTLLTALVRGENDALATIANSARASRLIPAARQEGLDDGERFVTVALPMSESATITASVALLKWAATFRGGSTQSSGPRATAKLLSAELRDRAFVARVRIEAFGTLADRSIQQVATWHVRWLVSEAGELSLREIRVLGGDQSSSPGVWFHDVTLDLLPRSLRDRPDLRRGGEYWPTRIDRVGESTRMGHQGLAIGDVDGDGLEDVYVAMCGGLPNLLLRQRPDGTFENIAAAANVAFLDETKGVLFADMDGDRDDDLLAAIGPFVLLALNDGNGVFDRFVRMQAPTGGAFYHLTVADYDRDGDLDVYGCRYVEEAYGTSVPMPYHDANNGPANVLFRNDGQIGNQGDVRFVDVTTAVGIDTNNRRFSTAAAWADVDGDGDQDLYVSNDFGRNCLYRNDAGRFTEVAAAAGVEDQAAGMGVAFADIDEDGDLDLYVTNMFSSAGNRIAFLDRFQKTLDPSQRRAIRDHALGNSVFLNRGDGTFIRAEGESMRMGRWGWGARFCDLDDDGREDIVAPNGFLTGHSAADC